MYPDDQLNRHLATSINTIQPSDVVAGKVYYIYAAWNGLDLEFTNKNFTSTAPYIESRTELSVDTWSEAFFEGDTPEFIESRRLSHLWDNNLKEFFESAIALSWPISFSIDLGENQDKNLTHIRIFYNTSMTTGRWGPLTPNNLEIWGTKKPSPNGSYSGWTKITDCISVKPSGLPYGTTSYVDDDIVPQAEVFKFKLETPRYRYIRFRVHNTWDDRLNNKIRLMELKLYGHDGLPDLPEIEW